jgi:hypothetical protein
MNRRTFLALLPVPLLSVLGVSAQGEVSIPEAGHQIHPSCGYGPEAFVHFWDHEMLYQMGKHFPVNEGYGWIVYDAEPDGAWYCIADMSYFDDEPEVSIPEGECEIECWDADWNPVACNDPCAVEDEEPFVGKWPEEPFLVLTLPNLGTGGG